MGSILWVIQKGSILWVIFSKQKRSNSLSHIFQKKSLRHNFWKKKNFKSASHQKKKKGPILWIKIQKHKFQVSASGTMLWVMRKINSLRIFSKKKINSLNQMKTWVTCKKKVFDSLSRIEKRGSILWLWVVYIWQKFNSLNHTQKEVQFFESHLSKEGSILWVILRKRFYSLNHI